MVQILRYCLYSTIGLVLGNLLSLYVHNNYAPRPRCVAACVTCCLATPLVLNWRTRWISIYTVLAIVYVVHEVNTHATYSWGEPPFHWISVWVWGVYTIGLGIGVEIQWHWQRCRGKRAVTHPTQIQVVMETILEQSTCD